MPQPDALDAPPAEGGWAALVGMDNRLARGVARAPVKVRTKLLVSFLVIAALLVLVGFLGLRFLGQANGRVEGLGPLKPRSTSYVQWQTDATLLRQLLGFRDSSESGQATLTGGKSSSAGGPQWNLVDAAIRFALSQLGASTTEAQYGFVPPPADERLVKQIRRDYQTVNHAVTTIHDLDGEGAAGSRIRPYLAAAITADQDLFEVTNVLANRTINQTSVLISANRSAYTSSRNFFVAVGVISVALALGLGLVLSWSLIGPIQRTEARLAEIAAGDFSGHLEVPNRDELGSLGANVNRMNDELQRFFGELLEGS